MTVISDLMHRYRAAWAKAHAEKIDAVNYASRTKTGMPDGYWQAEHAARLQLEVAEALESALREDADQGLK